MSSSLTNHLLRCSIATASGDEPKPQINFPAKLQRSPFSAVDFRAGKPNDLASSDVAVSSSRRRVLICVATLPCLLPLTQIIACLQANASQPGTKEYVLIKEEVRKVLSKGKAAGVLRLVFHDAGTFEIDDNTGMHLILRTEGYIVLQKAKTQIDAIQPGPDYEGKLPEEYLNASGLKKCFQRKGFST